MKLKSIEIFKDNFEKKNFLDVNKIYPYAIFDITYYENEVKRYGFISFTSTKECYFNFSIKQWSFINEFYDYVDFYCVSEIYDNPKISVISINELLEMNRTVTSIFIKK